MKRLTSRQYDYVKQLVVQHLVGNDVVLVGWRSDFNKGKVCSSRLMIIDEYRVKRLKPNPQVELGNKTMSNSLLDTKVLKSFHTGYHDSYYDYYKLNFVELFRYSNGLALMQEAQEEVAKEANEEY